MVTVAGTNGKGSTVAFIEAIARAAGLRVGAYTSPHLLDYRERVRIDGADAGDAALAQALAAVEAARNGTPLTYFEFGTLAALRLFERAGLDLALLEVGLGGRLDATNLVDADVAVITTVDLDQQEWLGPDRGDRTGEAGSCSLVAGGPGRGRSAGSVLRHALLRPRSGSSDFFFDRLPRWLSWRELGHVLELPSPALDAPVQLRNAATAIAALHALDIGSDEACAVAAARLPGRLQALRHHGVEVRVDVGHNPQAAREVAAWLRANRVPGRVHVLYAPLADKDVAGVVQALAGEVDQWWLAGTPGAGARGLAVADLAARLHDRAVARGARFDDPGVALDAVLAAAVAGDRVLVFGSFHAAELALRRLRGADSEAGGGRGV